MYIESFHIDGFGVFSDESVGNLFPGFSIFLGCNEAGKSTCLEFLRVMLTGYPDPRTKAGKRNFAPLRGGQAGGSMVLRVEGHGPLHLTRRPGPNGGLLTLGEADGTPLPPRVLQQLFFGVSPEVYRAVFGFSLSELERFQSLNEDGVRNALYGASFGPGLRSPSEALKILDKRAEEIFKVGGSNPALNKAIREWEELHAKIGEMATQCAGYDALAQELANRRKELAELRVQKSALEEKRSLLQRRLSVWRQRDDLVLIGVRLERLPPVSATFPEDGQARLARVQEARETCERQLAAHRQKRDALLLRRDTIQVDETLLAALPELRRLAERKSGYRHAREVMAGQEDACRRAADDLGRELTRLGPGWNCERIRNTDRSLFARENLERQAREMNAADTAYRAAVDALDTANQDVENAGREATAVREKLAVLPAPAVALSEEARDELRQDMGRLEEDRRQLPARERAVHAAKTTFFRAYDPLRLASTGHGPQEILENLLNYQDEALALASALQRDMAEADKAAQAVEQAVEQLAGVKARVDELRTAQCSSAPSREDLDARAVTLRSLRALSSHLHVEEERLQDLKVRISSHQAPAPVRSLPIIAAGILCILAGAAILGAHWMLGMTFAPWPGYLALGCGVAFLAGGLPRGGPEAKQHQQEMEQLRNRSKICAARVAELGEQARHLCETAGLKNLDPVSLDAKEMLLEREREQCFNAERSRRDMEALQKEMAFARTTIAERQGKARELEAVVQQTRSRWQERMRALHVDNVPSPESTAAFFARAESALLAFSGVATAAAEQQALQDELDALETRIRAVPAVAERLPEEADLTAVLDCARQVLTFCREADAVREECIKIEASLQHCENEQQRVRKRQDDAEEKLRQAEERLTAARKMWSQVLQSLGLGEELDPGTVRDAFKYMDNCLAAEATLERVRTDLSQSRAELAALEKPLDGLLAQLSRDPVQDADGKPDWLASLEAAQADAKAMADMRVEYGRLTTLLTEEEDELRAVEAALGEARHNETNLLALAGAKDAEDFFRLASVRDEQRDLQRRRDDLEYSLTQTAAPLTLEEFLASFHDGEQEVQKQDSDAITQDLKELLDREQELSTAVADLNVRVNELARFEDLARLRQQQAFLQESMHGMALSWSRYALAREILVNAKRSFERERQPEVIRQASEIFSRITDGRWRGISASLEDSSLRILPERGEPVSPNMLSRGAQEQAYLALRLAYIKDHAAHAAPLPVIMDEVLVNFDPERAARTARAFAELACNRDEAPHQMLYFTCHPHMVDILRAAVPTAPLFLVEHGQILAARD